MSDQAIDNPRNQHLIDTGRAPGIPSSENAELVAARHRIAELETQLAIHRVPWSCSTPWCPKRRFEAIAVMAGEVLPVQAASRIATQTAATGKLPPARETR